MKINSYLARGSGAYVIHNELADKIHGYKLIGYNRFLTLFPPLLYLLRSGNPDIIHMPPEYAPFFHDKNIPLVITFHGYSLDKDLRPFNSRLQNLHYQTDLRWLVQKALRQAGVVTCVSHYLADLVRKDTQYKGEIRVIYNGVDEERFSPVNKKPGQYFDVLFSGNLIRKKGSNLLPEIISKLNPQIRIHYTSGLRSKTVNFHHPRLIPLGRIEYRNMPSLYQSFDALLFPTVREGFGMAAAEAMACGLPVVASDTAAIPELVIPGKGGILCPVGAADRFADALNYLADSAALCREMGHFNRERIATEFTLTRMVTAYNALFDELHTAR